MNMTTKAITSPLMIQITPKKLLKFILVYSVIMNALIAELHFPNMIKYLNDILIFILAIFVVPKSYQKLREKNALLIGVAFIGILLSFFISDIVNLVPVNLAIWGGRNLYRFFIMFFGIVVYFTEDDVEDVMNTFLKLQAVNLVIGLYQFFILGLSQDTLGGIFGHGNGSGLDPFCLLIITYYANSYIASKNNIKKMVFSILSSMILAAIAEEKFIYVGIVVILVLAVILNRLNRKIVIAGAFTLLGIGIGMVLLKSIFPSMYKVMISLGEMIKYGETTYSEGYRIPRIGAFQVIKTLFLKTNLQCSFGLGFGNCDTSSFKIFQSAFYQKYGEYNYRWFTHQWTFLECGYVGFTMYLLFFIAIICVLIKNAKMFGKDNSYLRISSISYTFICILTIWYNASLKVDTAYIMFFGMAMGVTALSKSKRNGIIKKQF